MCCCYWPWQGGTNVHGEIEIKYFGGSATQHYIVRYMEVIDTKVSYYYATFQNHINDNNSYVCTVYMHNYM